ncbi:MAG: hypothetical protein U0237_05640 [Thermoleophilia bacterium]
MSLRITRRRAAALTAIAALAVAGPVAASVVPLPGPLGQVNDDPAAGIDPSVPVAAADVAGGSLAAGGRHVPWAVFQQQNGGVAQVFSRSFANGVWTTRGAALNLDPAKDAEAPSIDFAGPGRTVPWAAWYEDSAAFPNGATQILASRFDAAGNRWLPAGQDRTAGQKAPSLNINTDLAAENPAVFGGATTAGADPVPWVAWQELDGPAGTRREQIFVSRGVKAAAGQASCTGFSPGDGPVVNGFCWQQTGIARVSRTSLKSDNATDASLNVDTTRDAIEPDGAFTGPGDTVPWVVWYETGPSPRGLAGNEMVFAAKAVRDDAAKGGFHWVAVGRAGSGILDASDSGGPCAANGVAEAACSLNADPALDARDPRVAAGTMTPGSPTVPWVVWAEGTSRTRVFAARLVGDRFELLNGGQPLSSPAVSAATPDISFTGNTPEVTWTEAGRIRTGHFEGPAANPVFVTDGAEVSLGSGFAPRISSGCTATPATADGASCPGGAVGSPFILSPSGRNADEAKLAAHGHVPDAAPTGGATGVAATSAMLNGEAVTGNGPARVRFEYGPTAAYGSSTAPSLLPASRSGITFSAAVRDLPAGTPVHFRAVVESDFGSVLGPDAVFTTAAAPPVTANAAPRVRVTGLRPLVGRRGNVSLRLRLSVDEAATVTVQARRRGAVIATRTVVRTAPGAFRVRIGVGRRSGRVNLRITARDPQGAARTVTRGVLLVR